MPALVYRFLPPVAKTAFSRLYDELARLSGGDLLVHLQLYTLKTVGPTPLP